MIAEHNIEELKTFLFVSEHQRPTLKPTLLERYRGKGRARGWKSNSRLWTLIIQINMKSKCQLNTVIIPFWF